MIYIVCGKPGSGKTFFAIKHLLNNYFYYDSKIKDYFQKMQVNIVSNIEELKLNHFVLDSMIKFCGGVDEFFTIDYQKKLVNKMGRIVYFVDEANKYFQKCSDKVVDFFIYHRHLGIDFYLITASADSIFYKIRNLAEYIIEASPRSKRLINEFRYKKIVEGDTAGRIVLPFESNVFRLYKSMVTENVEKVGSVLHRYIVYIMVFIILAGLGFYWSINHFFNKGGKVIAYKEGKIVKEDVIDKKNEKKEKEKENKLEEFREVKIVEDEKDKKDKIFLDNNFDFIYKKINFYTDGKEKIFYDDKGRVDMMALVEKGLVKVVDGELYYKKIISNNNSRLYNDARDSKTISSLTHNMKGVEGETTKGVGSIKRDMIRTKEVNSEKRG